ncbi:Serine/threonine-protein kinase par-1 [Blyttiomyces sp. JEL0837]|nr:Serine/threonine-protein kinase par-1 [Blyttiomyces sp. JEL0837]
MAPTPHAYDASQSTGGEEGSLFLDRYRIEKILGEGSYGKVKLAMDLENNRKVALKVVDKSTIKRPEHVTRIKREVRILKLLNHPHIVKLYDVAETEREIVLSMEYVEGGELFDFIVAHTRLPEKVARKVFRQILSAVDYCHSSSIIHRDLKPENVLLDSEKTVKIIDFGFVNLYDPEDVLKTFCGSPYYASPEMILGRKYIGPEVDIWSLGVILFALLAGKLPFRDANQKHLYRKITTSSFEMPSCIEPDSADLIRRMLKPDPSERATLEQVMNHRWTVAGYPGPPDSLIPERPAITEPLDSRTLEAMRLFNYDPVQAKETLLNTTTGPVFSLYYLLREQEAAAAEKAAASVTSGNSQREYRSNTLTVPSTDDTSKKSSGSKISRRKSISGAIRQQQSSKNSSPSKSTNQLPSVGELSFVPDQAPPVPSLPNKQAWTPGTTSPKQLASTDGSSTPPIRTIKPVSPQESFDSFEDASGASHTLKTYTTSAIESAALSRRKSAAAQAAAGSTPFLQPQNGSDDDSAGVGRKSMKSLRRRKTVSAGPQRPTSFRTPGGDNSQTSSIGSSAVDITTIPHPPMPSQAVVSALRLKALTSDDDANHPEAADKPGEAFSPPATARASTVSAVSTGGGGSPASTLGRRLSMTLSNALGKMASRTKKRPESPLSPTASAQPITSPVAAVQNGPRVSKSIYGADTTSSKPPDEIKRAIVLVLENSGITYTWDGPFKVRCVATTNEFEVEICKIQGTQMHGLELRRKKGSVWGYQIVARTFIQKLKL